MKSSKNSKVLYKYNKITQQKKFHLLNLVLGEKMLIKDVILPLQRQLKLLESTIQQPKPFSSSIGMEINPISFNSNAQSSKTMCLPNLGPPSLISPSNVKKEHKPQLREAILILSVRSDRSIKPSKN